MNRLAEQAYRDLQRKLKRIPPHQHKIEIDRARYAFEDKLKEFQQAHPEYVEAIANGTKNAFHFRAIAGLLDPSMPPGAEECKLKFWSHDRSDWGYWAFGPVEIMLRSAYRCPEKLNFGTMTDRGYAHQWLHPSKGYPHWLAEAVLSEPVRPVASHEVGHLIEFGATMSQGGSTGIKRWIADRIKSGPIEIMQDGKDYEVGQDEFWRVVWVSGPPGDLVQRIKLADVLTGKYYDAQYVSKRYKKMTEAVSSWFESYASAPLATLEADEEWATMIMAHLYWGRLAARKGATQ